MDYLFCWQEPSTLPALPLSQLFGASRVAHLGFKESVPWQTLSPMSTHIPLGIPDRWLGDSTGWFPTSLLSPRSLYFHIFLGVFPFRTTATHTHKPLMMLPNISSSTNWVISHKEWRCWLHSSSSSITEEILCVFLRPRSFLLLFLFSLASFRHFHTFHPTFSIMRLGILIFRMVAWFLSCFAYAGDLGILDFRMVAWYWVVVSLTVIWGFWSFERLHDFELWCLWCSFWHPGLSNDGGRCCASVYSDSASSIIGETPCQFPLCSCFLCFLCSAAFIWPFTRRARFQVFWRLYDTRLFYLTNTDLYFSSSSTTEEIWCVGDSGRASFRLPFQDSALFIPNFS